MIFLFGALFLFGVFGGLFCFGFLFSFSLVFCLVLYWFFGAYYFGVFFSILFVIFSEAQNADVTHIYSRREVRPSLEVRSCETETDSSKHILPLPALQVSTKVVSPTK